MPPKSAHSRGTKKRLFERKRHRSSSSASTTTSTFSTTSTPIATTRSTSTTEILSARIASSSSTPTTPTTPALSTTTRTTSFSSITRSTFTSTITASSSSSSSSASSPTPTSSADAFVQFVDGLGLSNSTTSAATSTSLLLPASPTSDVSNRDNQQNSSSSSPRLNFSNPAVIGGTAAIAAVILLIVIWLVIFVRRHMLNKSLRDRSAGEGSGNRRAGRNRAERMSFAGSFNEMIKKDRNYFVSQAVNDNQLSASRSEKAKKKSTLSTPTIDHLCRDHSSSTNNNSIITKYSFDQGRQDILNSSAPSTTFIYTHPEQIPIVKPFEYHMNNMRSTTISSQNSSVVNQDNLLQKISSLTTANSKQSGYIQPLPQDLETEAEDLTSTASSPVQQPAPPMQTRQLRRFIPPTEYDD